MFKPYKPFPPIKPNKKDLLNCNEIIYRDIFIINEDLKIEDILTDSRPSENLSNFKKPIKNISKLSLQDLIDLVPSDVKYSDVYFKLNYDDMGIDYLDVSWECKLNKEKINKLFEDKMKEYEINLKKYKNEHDNYENDLKEYNAFIKQNRIKQLEEELERIKNS